MIHARVTKAFTEEGHEVEAEVGVHQQAYSQRLRSDILVEHLGRVVHGAPQLL